MSSDGLREGSGVDGGPPLQRSLVGIRVVTFEHAVAAPICTRHLADLGADVVKVESPAGDFARRYDDLVDGESTHFVWLNAGKRSVSLDLRTSAGQEIARRLVLGADVVVANLAPGVLSRRVLPLDQFPESTVVCEITGYEPDGDYGDRKAFDLIVQGELGVTMSTGTEDHPAKPGVSLADLAAGTYALVGVLGALYQRARTGVGAHLHVSLSTAVAEWMSPLLLAAANGGADPPRAGLSHQTIAPYGAFVTGDGHLLNIAVQNDDQWHRFVAGVLGRPELADDERFRTNTLRVANRDELNDVLTSTLREVSAGDLERRLEAADVPWGRLNAPTQVLGHPDVAADQRWRTVVLPNRRTSRVLAGPFPGPDDRALPGVGEHTAEVMADLGYTPAAIDHFVDTGVLDRAGEDDAQSVGAASGSEASPLTAEQCELT